MTRPAWEQVPHPVRETVEHQTGTVLKAETMTRGLTPGMAAKLTTERTRRFVKAIPADHPAAVLYRRELAAGRALPPGLPAPRLLWGAHTGGWIVLLHEWIDGREADLSPGSPDIDPVLALVRDLADRLTPTPWPDAPTVDVNLHTLTEKAHRLLAERPSDLPDLDRYEQALADFAPVADQVHGDTLLHYDLSPSNISITTTGARALDWAFTCNGAPWIEPAMLVPRLIEAGHAPAHAEHLLGQAGIDLPDDPAVTGLAVLWTMYREFKAHYGPEGVRPARARAAAAGRAWVRYRTG